MSFEAGPVPAASAEPALGMVPGQRGWGEPQPRLQREGGAGAVYMSDAGEAAPALLRTQGSFAGPLWGERKQEGSELPPGHSAAARAQHGALRLLALKFPCFLLAFVLLSKSTSDSSSTTLLPSPVCVPFPWAPLFIFPSGLEETSFLLPTKSLFVSVPAGQEAAQECPPRAASRASRWQQLPTEQQLPQLGSAAFGHVQVSCAHLCPAPAPQPGHLWPWGVLLEATLASALARGRFWHLAPLLWTAPSPAQPLHTQPLPRTVLVHDHPSHHLSLCSGEKEPSPVTAGSFAKRRRHEAGNSLSAPAVEEEVSIPPKKKRLLAAEASESLEGLEAAGPSRDGEAPGSQGLEGRCVSGARTTPFFPA